MRHELALAPTAREQRANDGALLLDGGVGQHDEHERHDHDEHDEQNLPHHLVALRIVKRVGHRLVRVAVGEIGHELAFVGKRFQHVFLERCAVDELHVAIVEEERVAVDERPLVDLVERFLRDLRHREAERIENEARVVLEQARVIGQGHDADDRHRPPGKLHLVAHLEVVVLAEHAIERNLIVRLGRPALAVDSLVEIAAVHEHTRLRAVGRTFEGQRAVIVELLDNRAAKRLDRRNRLVVGLEGRGEVAVLGVVVIVHARADKLDGARRHEEARCERDSKREQ